MEGYSGYPADQCLIEMLDYWLRHHQGQPTWKDVAKALNEIKLHQLAENILQVYVTGISVYMLDHAYQGFIRNTRGKI